jgi:hypothetical protein
MYNEEGFLAADYAHQAGQYEKEGLFAAGYAHLAGQYNTKGLLAAGYAHLLDQFDKEGLLATGYSHLAGQCIIKKDSLQQVKQTKQVNEILLYSRTSYDSFQSIAGQ